MSLMVNLRNQQKPQQKSNSFDDTGALWFRVSDKNEEYFSGYLDIDGNRNWFNAYQVKNKKNEKQPDLRIFPRKIQLGDGQ